jgi:UrcA family protein
MKNPLVVAAAIVGISVSLAAHAGVSQLATKVRVGDLDLNSTAGATVLYQRIERAAARVCVHLEVDRTLITKRQHAQCVNEAISTTVASVGRSALTSHAAARLARKRVDILTLAGS